MSNNRKPGTGPAAKAPHRKINLLPFLASAAVMICITVVFFVSRNGTSNANENPGGEGSDTDTAVSSETQNDGTDPSASVESLNESAGAQGEPGGAVVISAGESLVIPAADITADASFFSVVVDGTQMEIIAVRDSEGNIRTAFNTCQICYDSGRGYYVQSGDYLVCQNCGNRFSMDQVGIESGGCNPWPIFSENKTVTADGIYISYDFLMEANGIFANWKGSY